MTASTRGGLMAGVFIAALGATAAVIAYPTVLGTTLIIISAIWAVAAILFGYLADDDPEATDAS